MNLDLDSTDFTAHEAESAHAVDTVDDVITELRAQECTHCSNRLFPTVHEQLRRSGGLYWRVGLACSRMHEASLVFKVGCHQPQMQA